MSMENGCIDSILFVMPNLQPKARWSKTELPEDTEKRWGGTIRRKGIGEQMEGKWMRVRGICRVVQWFALGCKEQKVGISAEVPLPNH